MANLHVHMPGVPGRSGRPLLDDSQVTDLALFAKALSRAIRMLNETWFTVKTSLQKEAKTVAILHFAGHLPPASSERAFRRLTGSGVRTGSDPRTDGARRLVGDGQRWSFRDIM
jgi:hypothetical protein